MIQIKQIADKKDFLKLYDWIQDCPFTDTDAETVLGNCLLGKYWGLIGLIDDRPAGLVIGQTRNKTAFIIALWCKNNVKTFRDAFFSLLKAKGFNQIIAHSNHHEDAYQKVLGLKKLWSIYGRSL